MRLKAGDIFDILKEKSDSMEETGKQLKVIVHEMEYKGGQMVSDLRLRHYSNSDYRKYRRVYEECFHEMRAALQRFPVDICASREKLEQEKGNIYILEVDGKLIGSVAIYGNEIDDLIVAKDFQRQGHGEALLQFAVVGAGNKLDGSQFRVSDIYKTKMCPLAKVMRRELKKRGVRKLKVVYSEEKPIRPLDDMSISCRTNCICPPGAKHKCTERRDIPGSTAFVPSVAGLIIADEVVKDLCSEEMRQD